MTTVKHYKGPVRADGTPIEVPKKVLRLQQTAKANKRKPNRSRFGDFLIYSMLALVACAMAFPLVFAICSSLKPLDELFRFPPTLFPRQPTLDNFSDLLVTMGQSWVPFTRYISNTAFITLAGTIGNVFIGSLAAYVLAKYDFPLGRTFFSLVSVIAPACVEQPTQKAAVTVRKANRFPSHFLCSTSCSTTIGPPRKLPSGSLR